MDITITYSLRDGQKRSDQYYKQISDITDEVLAEAENRAKTLLDSFQTYLQDTNREALRIRSEYAFELLTLGVLWRVYAGYSLGLSRTSKRLLEWLLRQRKKIIILKPVIDIFRGVLAEFILPSTNSQSGRIPAPKKENLDHLLDWLSASGDFKEEVKRLSAWRDFLTNQDPEEIVKNLNIAISYAAWFDKRSMAVLGHYTPHVDQFLEKSIPDYRWREDKIFCGRQRVEYHLNMIGAEILNRTMRDRFLDTERKIVLLPPCMKAKFDDGCEATPTNFGERCAACTPDCRVHQVTQLGKKYGFDVLIMGPELSAFSDNKKAKPTMDSSVGIIGASCPLTNVTGGWETRDLGVPAQGILLDYCGCPWHWDLGRGLSTDINFNQLLRLLDIKD